MGVFSIAVTALVLFLLDGAEGFWRMGCSIIHTGRVDSIVNPGAIAQHAHTIVGGSSKLSQATCRFCS